MSQTPSEIKSVNPQFAAKHIAKMLDADPVMARLVKDFIAVERLKQLLEIPDDLPEITKGE